MDLHYVKDGWRLLWPMAVVEHFPVEERYAGHERGRRRELWRKGLCERGSAGYVVDMDDPVERVLCAEQMAVLVPVTEIKDGRRRPRRPSPIESDPYDAFLRQLAVSAKRDDRRLAARHAEYVEARDAELVRVRVSDSEAAVDDNDEVEPFEPEPVVIRTPGVFDGEFDGEADGGNSEADGGNSGGDE